MEFKVVCSEKAKDSMDIYERFNLNKDWRRDQFLAPDICQDLFKWFCVDGKDIAEIALILSCSKRDVLELMRFCRV